MGVDYEAQKRRLLSTFSNFDARWSMNYRIVTHTCRRLRGRRIYCRWIMMYLKFLMYWLPKQPYLFLASCIDSSHMFFTLFQRMVRAAMGCVITGEIDPTWLIALPHWDAAKRSQTYTYIYIYNTYVIVYMSSIFFIMSASNRLTETGHKSLIFNSILSGAANVGHANLLQIVACRAA